LQGTVCESCALFFSKLSYIEKPYLFQYRERGQVKLHIEGTLSGMRIPFAWGIHGLALRVCRVVAGVLAALYLVLVSRVYVPDWEFEAPETGERLTVSTIKPFSDFEILGRVFGNLKAIRLVASLDKTHVQEPLWLFALPDPAARFWLQSKRRNEAGKPE
jgi:hypothetical protein